MLRILKMKKKEDYLSLNKVLRDFLKFGFGGSFKIRASGIVSSDLYFDTIIPLDNGHLEAKNFCLFA